MQIDVNKTLLFLHPVIESRDPILRVSVSKVSGLGTLNIAENW